MTLGSSSMPCSRYRISMRATPPMIMLVRCSSRSWWNNLGGMGVLKQRHWLRGTWLFYGLPSTPPMEDAATFSATSASGRSQKDQKTATDGLCGPWERRSIRPWMRVYGALPDASSSSPFQRYRPLPAPGRGRFPYSESRNILTASRVTDPHRGRETYSLTDC